MESVYIFSTGVLKRKDNSLVLETENGKKHIPVENVSEIRVFGELTTNKRLLEFLTKKGIIMHFYNRDGYYVGTYYPRESNSSGSTLIRQAQHYLDPTKRLKLAANFVEGALYNMNAFLKYHNSRGKDLEKQIHNIEILKDKIQNVESIPELMALEGNAREVYYSSFNVIVSDERFHIHRREKRPPTNYMNTLISFGNSLMYTTVLSEIFRTHLDPRIGFLHETNLRRFTLHLDIAEIFKPVVVDRVIIRLVNRSQIKPKHFSEIAGGLKLNDAGKKLFAKEFENRLRETVYHSGLKRNVSYRRLIRLEAYKVEKHILEIDSYKPFHDRSRD